ncbi:MAG: DUF1624 domain-containing protein [Planctomycetes bacterium]|nr:DUF1624 domain-containing protein [Planctomycetota bacterium]
MTAAPSSPPAAQRLLSLDALRGFDMFWIVGAEEIVHAIHKVKQGGWADVLAGQLTHSDWEGVSFYDLIFPLFVFIAGVSLVISLGRIIEQSGKLAAVKRVLWRGLLLYLLGVLYYGGLAGGLEKVRLMGVLQRIALSYLFAGLLFCAFRRRGLIASCVALLAVYWALMTFVPVPGAVAGNFTEGKNLANYIDKVYLPYHKWDGDHDPEGLLSTLPAIASCLLGAFAGLLLKKKEISEQKKTLWLFGAGAAGVLLGHLWGLQFPVVKKIWTSSYVLVAGGYSCILLALFHQIIGIWKFERWARPFIWIGVNPLAIYLAYDLLDFPQLARRLVGDPEKIGSGAWGEVLVTGVALALTFLFVHFLYRRKIFLRF